MVAKLAPLKNSLVVRCGGGSNNSGAIRVAGQEGHEGDGMRMKILLGILLVVAAGGVAAQKLEPFTSSPGCGK